MKNNKIKAAGLLFTFGGTGILFAIWTFASLLTSPFIVPPPWSTLAEVGRLIIQPHTWIQISFTLFRVFSGFFLALLLGTAGGLIAGKIEWIQDLLKPAVLLLQGIPPILWAIPLILLFGTGGLSPVIVITLICLPLVFLNILEGVKSVPRELEEMVKVYAPGLSPQLREIILPYLAPFFSASLKLGITLGIKASVVGEYFGANNGIGFQVQAAYQSMQIKKLFAWGLLLIAIIIIASRFKYPGERKKASTDKQTFLTGGRSKIKTLALNQKNLLKSEEFLYEEEKGKHLLLKEISFSYPEQEELLISVNLPVKPGEAAVITGDSGIGKTTLLKIIARLLKPDKGYVEGPDKIGFVFQDDRLIPWRSVLRNVAFPIHYNGNSWKVSFSRAQELLLIMGLGSEGKKLPDELSGGMRKRAALARCFARKPELVILDEPFSGLHKEARVKLWEIFFEALYPSSIPAVIVTHYPEELTGYADCVFYNLRGKPASLYPV